MRQPKQPRSLKQLEADLCRTFEAISVELERRATAALWKLAKSHPTEVVTFCSAMGTYGFDVNDNEVNPPVSKLFDRICGEYGYSAIPVVRMKITNGTLDRKLDW